MDIILDILIPFWPPTMTSQDLQRAVLPSVAQLVMNQPQQIKLIRKRHERGTLPQPPAAQVNQGLVHGVVFEQLLVSFCFFDQVVGDFFRYVPPLN
jgi:hypothetical protein